jgi:hypothetical protein
MDEWEINPAAEVVRDLIPIGKVALGKTVEPDSAREERLDRPPPHEVHDIVEVEIMNTVEPRPDIL